MGAALRSATLLTWAVRDVGERILAEIGIDLFY
jgi:hypothetical protein